MNDQVVNIAFGVLLGLAGLVWLGFWIAEAYVWCRRVYRAVLLVQNIEDADAAVVRITRSARRELQRGTDDQRRAS